MHSNVVGALKKVGPFEEFKWLECCLMTFLMDCERSPSFTQDVRLNPVDTEELLAFGLGADLL